MAIKKKLLENVAGTNLSVTNRDYAVFLPSISAVYAHHVSKDKDHSKSPRQTDPKGIPGSTYLNFLDPDKGLYYYDSALYSAGHAILDIERSKEVETCIHNRDKSSTFILGDSGGFQIGKGVIDFDFKDFTGSKSNAVREKILRWLEEISDYAMVLDVPAWAVGKQPGIDSFEDALSATLFNNNYFLKNRTGKCKFLNVLQGRSKHETDIWFDAVKDMPFEGWAFANPHSYDYEIALHRLITMRDNHYFEENSNGEKRNQLHFLGQSKLTIGCILTAIQRKMREQIDPDIMVTYDSASAFICSARGGTYTKDSFDPKKFSYQMEKMYDNHDLIGSNEPFPWVSTIGDHLTMGDICVRPEGWDDRDIKTSWDTYSYILLMAHNVERHIRALQQANRIFSLPHDSTGKLYLPAKLIEFTEVLDEIFDSETPFDVINEHHKLLNDVAKRSTGKGVTLQRSNFLELFDTKEEFNSEDFDLENQEDELLIKLEEEDDI